MRKTSLFPVFFVYFLDNFSFAIVFPLFSSLILTSYYSFLPEGLTMIQRNILLGILSAAFPLGLFLGAPLIGNFADYKGRKKAFFITISGLIVGSLLTASSLHLKSFYFLLAARAFTGFFSGNLTLCLATVSDLSPTAKIRAKNFGLLTALGGISWLLAMIVGGEMSNPARSSYFNPTLPFLISAIVAFFNLIILAIFFKEPLRNLDHAKFTLTEGFVNITHAFRTVSHRSLYLILLLFAVGWLIIMQWFAGYSLQRFHVNREQLVVSLLIVGLCWSLSSSLLNEYLVDRFALPKIPFTGLFFLCILLLFGNHFEAFSAFTAINGLAAAVASIIMSNLLNLISLSAGQRIQGKILGISQSVLALAQFLSPMTGALVLLGQTAHFYHSAAFIIFIAFLLFWKKFKTFKPQVK